MTVLTGRRLPAPETPIDPSVVPAAVTGSGLPRYSVVIPAVNEEHDIGRCLESLAKQDFQGSYEVIVVDNNSHDRTASIARQLGATVVFEGRAGVCWARQRGTQAARGEIVVSTDADTTFDPGWLSRIDQSFRRGPAIVAVTGPCKFVDGPTWGVAYGFLLFGLVALVRRVTGRVLYVSATNIAFRRAAFTGYDTSLTQGGDELDVLRRLRAHGPVAFDLGNPTYTSSRRLRRGLVYNIFVTCIYYYLCGYALNRLFGRPILGTAPAIRESGHERARERFVRVSLASAVAMSVVLAIRFAVPAVAG
jgi:glycosyltransferase involved in cell wall biosynthesis